MSPRRLSVPFGMIQWRMHTRGRSRSKHYQLLLFTQIDDLFVSVLAAPMLHSVPLYRILHKVGLQVLISLPKLDPLSPALLRVGRT